MNRTDWPVEICRRIFRLMASVSNRLIANKQVVISVKKAGVFIRFPVAVVEALIAYDAEHRNTMEEVETDEAVDCIKAVFGFAPRTFRFGDFVVRGLEIRAEDITTKTGIEFRVHSATDPGDFFFNLDKNKEAAQRTTAEHLAGAKRETEKTSLF